MHRGKRLLVTGIFFLLTILPAARAEVLPNGGRELIPAEVLGSIQRYLLEQRVDGWLFTGQGALNDLDREFLGLTGEGSRHRWLILLSGIANYRRPLLIYHPEDEPLFRGINLYPLPYRNRRELLQLLRERLLPIATRLYVNSSPGFAIPELDRFDSGLAGWLESNGAELLSGGSLLSFYHTRWQLSHLESHRRAARGIDSLWVMAEAHLREKLSRGKRITDLDLEKFLEKQLKKQGLEPVGRPTVARNERTREPAFVPDKRTCRALVPGDLLYLEVAARPLKQPGAMFARLGRTLYLGAVVPDSLAEPWSQVVLAADTALALLRFSLADERKVLPGWQVDSLARRVLSATDPEVLPRPLGMNLNPYGHCFGVNFDNYLARDERRVMPGLGFTLEPGIWREACALRTCANLFLEYDPETRARKVVLSAPLQRAIVPLLAPPGETPALADAPQP